MLFVLAHTGLTHPLCEIEQLKNIPRIVLLTTQCVYIVVKKVSRVFSHFNAGWSVLCFPLEDEERSNGCRRWRPFLFFPLTHSQRIPWGTRLTRHLSNYTSGWGQGYALAIS